METSELVALSIGGFIVILVIAYNVIASATNANSILKIQRMQLFILKEMALKNGVEPEKLDAIIEKHNV